MSAHASVLLSSVEHVWDARADIRMLMSIFLKICIQCKRSRIDMCMHTCPTAAC